LSEQVGRIVSRKQ